MARPKPKGDDRMSLISVNLPLWMQEILSECSYNRNKFIRDSILDNEDFKQAALKNQKHKGKLEQVKRIS